MPSIRSARRHPSSDPFATGAVVLVTLNSPREKFWGMVLSVNAAGVSLRGVELHSFDDFLQMARDGEEPVPNTLFFPMHRVERVELDARMGAVESLSERFLAQVRRSAASVLASGAPIAVPAAKSRKRGGGA